MATEEPSRPAEATETPGIETGNAEASLMEAPPSEGEAVTDETKMAWACPKDATEMAPMGRRGRSGAWRCSTCGGIFIDTEAMRRGRGARPPMWAPVVFSVVMSVVTTVVVKRLMRRLRTQPPA